MANKITFSLLLLLSDNSEFAKKIKYAPQRDALQAVCLSECCQ